MPYIFQNTSLIFIHCFRLTASNFAISATDISEFSLKAKNFVHLVYIFPIILPIDPRGEIIEITFLFFAHNISSVAGKLHCLCLRRVFFAITSNKRHLIFWYRYG